MNQSPPNRARRKNDPEATRERVLSAAYGLFHSQGYNGTSMLEIAAAGEVTSGALHHHFATKKALGLAVIREKLPDAVEEIWLAPVRAAPSAVDGVVGVLRHVARLVDAQGSVRGCPVNNLTLELAFADADFRAELRRLFDDWRAAIAEKFRADAKPGRDPEELATLAIAAYSGAMAMAKVEQSGAPLDLCAQQLAVLLPRP